MTSSSPNHDDSPGRPVPNRADQLVNQRRRAAEARPLVAPCRDLRPGDPIQWLAAGWRDYCIAPALSVAWGLISVFILGSVAWAGWLLGRWVLMLSVLSGFVFIAPLLAFALYSVSRQLQQGLQPTLAQTFQSARQPFANALIFALVLLIIFLLWARAASMVHIFFPAGSAADHVGLIRFLLVGSAVGSLFALVTFSASAFSLPFVANREVDVVTAVISSINAVLRNKWSMLTWAGCIAGLTAIGLASGLLGFVVIIPWLGYATWHGYRAALQTESWPTLQDPASIRPSTGTQP